MGETEMAETKTIHIRFVDPNYSNLIYEFWVNGRPLSSRIKDEYTFPARNDVVYPHNPLALIEAIEWCCMSPADNPAPVFSVDGTAWLPWAEFAEVQ